MNLRSFNVGCPCCCFDPMVVICIYDESSPIYTDCTGDTYLSDKDLWEEFIVGRTGTVRFGIIIPRGDEDLVRCATEDWPFDSDRLEVDRLVVGLQTPRVLEQDILDIFETIRTTPNTIKDPQLLLFVLDNSGSITLDEFQAELDAAKVQLELDFPNMVILDDISNSAERWLRDARVGSENEGCP